MVNPTTVTATVSDFAQLTAVEVGFFRHADDVLIGSQDYPRPETSAFSANVEALRRTLPGGLYAVKVRGVAGPQRGPWVQAANDLAEVQYIPLPPTNVAIS